MKLQTGSPRLATRKSYDVQVSGSLEVGHNKGDAVTDAYFKLPTLTSAQRTALTAEEGMVVYDSTLGKVMEYRAGGWGATDGTAAGSLDAAYNGGGTITVDAANVLLNLADASNDYALVIDSTDSSGTLNDMLKLQTTGAATVTDGIDVSDAGITNAINVGGNTILGTTAVINFTNFDVDGSGNTTVGGTLAVTGAVTLSSTLASGNLTVTGTIANSGALTSQGQVIIDVDSAEAFLIRENGDVADVLTVDTTQDAGDTTMLLTTKVTTGNAFHIDASTITSGNGLKITVVEGTMTSTGAAISVENSGGEVFAVRDDGTVLMNGTAEGTDVLTLTTGDLTVTDGDITVSGGEVSITDGVTTSGAGLTLVSSVTTAVGFDLSAASLTTGKALDISNLDAITTGKAIHVDATGVTQTSGILVHIDSASTAITGAGRLFRSDHTGNAGSSAVLNEFASAAADETVVLRVTASAALALGTLLDLSGTAVTTGTILDMGGLDALTTGTALNIVSNSADTGTRTLLVVTQDNASATGATVASFKQDSTGDGVSIQHTGAIADNAAALDIVGTGTPAAAGSNLLRVDGSGLTATNAPTLVEVVGASKDVTGLLVDADSTTDSAVKFTSDGAKAADKAVLEVVGNVSASNADSQIVRIQQQHTTGANVPLGILQADVSEPLILFESAEGSGNSVDATNTTEGALVGFLRISVNGTDQYITYNAAPSA